MDTQNYSTCFSGMYTTALSLRGTRPAHPPPPRAIGHAVGRQLLQYQHLLRWRAQIAQMLFSDSQCAYFQSDGDAAHKPAQPQVQQSLFQAN
jgi:hypothetical protein